MLQMIYNKLKVELYEKQTGVKVTIQQVSPAKLVEGNLQYIVEKIK